MKTTFYVTLTLTFVSLSHGAAQAPRPYTPTISPYDAAYATATLITGIAQSTAMGAITGGAIAWNRAARANGTHINNLQPRNPRDVATVMACCGGVCLGACIGCMCGTLLRLNHVTTLARFAKQKLE